MYDSIETFLDNEKMYSNLGIPYKKSIMLYEIPGTGKTFTAYAISNHFKMPLFKLNKNIFKSGEILNNSIQKIPYKSVVLIVIYML